MGVTKIEWCDFTFNPFIGCTKVSPGCDRCYAATLALRYGWVKQWGEPGKPGDYKRTSPANWRKPLQWAKWHRENLERFNACGSAQMMLGDSTVRRTAPRRSRVFCASLADVFDNQVPTEWRFDLFDLIYATPELDWLLLTKRPENIAKMIDTKTVRPNVWLGFTAEDQEHFDRRWPIMRDIPAAVRFCSYEPAIGPLRLPWGSGTVRQLDWLICGGESGAGHRPMDPKWEEDIRLDCEQGNVAYFFKQMAGKKPIPADFPIVRQFPRAA